MISLGSHRCAQHWGWRGHWEGQAGATAFPLGQDPGSVPVLQLLLLGGPGPKDLLASGLLVPGWVGGACHGARLCLHFPSLHFSFQLG